MQDGAMPLSLDMSRENLKQTRAAKKFLKIFRHAFLGLSQPAFSTTTSRCPHQRTRLRTRKPGKASSVANTRATSASG